METAEDHEHPDSGGFPGQHVAAINRHTSSPGAREKRKSQGDQRSPKATKKDSPPTTATQKQTQKQGKKKKKKAEKSSESTVSSPSVSAADQKKEVGRG